MSQPLSDTASYILTNKYTGPDSPLQVDRSSPDLRLFTGLQDSSATALEWQFRTASQAGKYNICTNCQSIPYCLDILRDNKLAPHLAAPGYYSGQQWTLLPSAANTYKLSNDYSGSGFYLDTYSDTHVAFMSSGDFSGQYWSLTAVHTSSNGSSTSTTASPSGVPLSSTSTLPAVTSAASTQNPLSGHSAPTNNSHTTLRLGVGLGVGIGIPLLIAAIILFFWHRKKKHQVDDSKQSEYEVQVSQTGRDTGRESYKAELPALDVGPPGLNYAELEASGR